MTTIDDAMDDASPKPPACVVCGATDQELQTYPDCTGPLCADAYNCVLRRTKQVENERNR